MATFVLVHGAWHGAWCWRRVARLLAKNGHEVFTPTLTGVGERSHLLNPFINVDIPHRRCRQRDEMAAINGCRAGRPLLWRHGDFRRRRADGEGDRVAGHARRLHAGRRPGRARHLPAAESRAGAGGFALRRHHHAAAQRRTVQGQRTRTAPGSTRNARRSRSRPSCRGLRSLARATASAKRPTSGRPLTRTRISMPVSQRRAPGIGAFLSFPAATTSCSICRSGSPRFCKRWLDAENWWAYANTAYAKSAHSRASGNPDTLHRF